MKVFEQLREDSQMILIVNSCASDFRIGIQKHTLSPKNMHKVS